jgi:hypothetical protein
MLPRTALALAAAAFAIAAPAAQADQDLRSPDARDAAGHPLYYTSYASDATHTQDLRSPDTRDAANHVVVPPVTAPRVVRVSVPSATGFDWADAAIGAGTSFGLMLLIAGGVTVLSRRRIAV